MPRLQGQESTRSWSSTDWHQSCHHHCLHKSRMLCRIYMAQPAKYARHETSCWKFSSLHVHPVCWWFNNKNKTDLQPYGFGMCISEHLLQTSKSELKLTFTLCCDVLKPKKNHCSWFATMWQSCHVGWQNNIIFFTEFPWKKSLVPREEIQFCSCNPAWPPWRQLQTSNNISFVSICNGAPVH